jgi:hypothetical protein
VTPGQGTLPRYPQVPYCVVVVYRQPSPLVLVSWSASTLGKMSDTIIEVLLRPCVMRMLSLEVSKTRCLMIRPRFGVDNVRFVVKSEIEGMLYRASVVFGLKRKKNKGRKLQGSERHSVVNTSTRECTLSICCGHKRKSSLAKTGSDGRGRRRRDKSG